MLLNAAHVVTAAERCDAIDEENGRIPINFLLSRSTDLDDNVKDQLQQLAATSPNISIMADRRPKSQTIPHPAPDGDAEMTDLHCPELDVPDPQHDAMEKDDPEVDVIAPAPAPPPSCDHMLSEHMLDDHVQTEDEEEAFKDIDRETGRPDRNIIRRQKRNQTLTRKAIRKHTGGKKANAKENKDHGMDSCSSTMNTVVGSDCMQSSIASSASQHSNTPRRRWKDWEDQLLMQVVAEHGPTRWNSLANHFPGRNGRQVRLRWMNHLQPSLDKRPWRPEEDAVLLEAHRALGNKWAQISVRLGGRTDNSVKNRYKSIVRRNAREAKLARKQE